jgi:hypothetical protein
MVIGAIGVNSSGKPTGPPELLSDRNGSIQATRETTNNNGRPTSSALSAPH